MPRSESIYLWDKRIFRYRHRASGQLVSHQSVWRGLADLNDAATRRIRQFAAQLGNREITLRAFGEAMRDEIRRQHILVAVTANGGWEQMTPSAWGKVGARLKKEYGHLNQFLKEIERRKVARGSGRLRSRAQSYFATVRTQYWQELQNNLRDRSRNPKVRIEARRVLGGVLTEHCSGCDALHGKWMPVDQLPAIGSQECAWFCACSVIWRIINVTE